MVCIVSPLCEVYMSNAFCVCQCHHSLWEEMSLSSNECVSESNSNISPVISEGCKVSPCSCIAECTVMQFGTQQNQQLLTQHCLACCMLLLWQGMDWTVELKIDISMKLHLKKVMKKSLKQTGGHWLLAPYCTKQRNKYVYLFLSSPTDCIWTDLPPHSDKPAPPCNLNIIIRLELKHLRIHIDMCSTFKFYCTKSPLTAEAICKGYI